MSIVMIPLRLIAAAFLAFVAGACGTVTITSVNDKDVRERDIVLCWSLCSVATLGSWTALFGWSMHPAIRYPCFLVTSVAALAGILLANNE